MADDAEALAAEAAEAADDGVVVAEFAVAGQRNEIGGQSADIIQAMGPLGMAGDLGLLPRSELRIEVLERLGGLGLEP